MKTAVEWLVDYLTNIKELPFIRQDLNIHEQNILNDIIEQAKEMEKEQMKLSRFPIAYENKSWQGLMERHFEQWYNETFKSEE